MCGSMRCDFSLSGLAVVAASAAVLFAAVQACITVPPPDLATPPLHPPVIDHAGVIPLQDATLSTWPTPQTPLLIPIELFDPDESFEYAVFIDYDPSTTTAADVGPVLVRPPPPVMDGGTYLLEVVTLPSAPLDGLCHKLEVDVARSFASVHVPDSLGGDSVWWWYGPNGCPPSWQEDGALPADAPYDGIQLIPDSGGTE